MSKYFRIFVTVFLLVSAFAGTVNAYQGPAVTVLLEDNGTVTTYKTDKETIGEFLEEQGITLEATDKMDALLTDPVEMPDVAGDSAKKITIHRGIDVKVDFPDNSETIRVEKGLSASALAERLSAERKIKYELLDLVPEHALQSGQVVRLVMSEEAAKAAHKVMDAFAESISKTPIVEQLNESAGKIAKAISEVTADEEEIVEIPFETVYETSFEISGGTEIVKQEGANGQKKVVYLKTMLGGEISREVKSEEVIKEPVSKIIVSGVGGILEADPEDLDSAKALTMSATAYTAGYQCTGKRPGDKGYGVTASGRMVRPGIVAVDPKVIPLGTRLYVEGYGYALAADTGSAIKGNKIDLYYESLNRANEFGRQNVVVYVLE